MMRKSKVPYMITWVHYAADEIRAEQGVIITIFISYLSVVMHQLNSLLQLHLQLPALQLAAICMVGLVTGWLDYVSEMTNLTDFIWQHHGHTTSFAYKQFVYLCKQ